ncbi:PREDICTED: interleukin-5 receptor subunit alpha [Elephantulus edwardii]|uniref:interleukin-5 receptor subunit alpha n=1 Tax=Elephantulus edwardii TaxID=28737 RepID=UPI0003F05AFF|nr:PREDICTED: interleukin-5 receptor subunit alpha [Elephantulus edwardii]
MGLLRSPHVQVPPRPGPPTRRCPARSGPPTSRSPHVQVPPRRCPIRTPGRSGPREPRAHTPLPEEVPSATPRSQACTPAGAREEGSGQLPSPAGWFRLCFSPRDPGLPATLGGDPATATAATPAPARPLPGPAPTPRPAPLPVQVTTTTALPGACVTIMAAALLILFRTTVILQADLLPDKTFALLPPVNFTAKVTGLAQIQLQWEPNPHQGPRDAALGYRVRINAPQEDEYETRDTESQCISILHKGFSVSVQTIYWDKASLPDSSWVSAELKDPPGSPGTSAVNLTCTTNTVASDSPDFRPYPVSLQCSWLAGQDAPEDTQYFLYYRYGSWTEKCQEYSRDTLKRNIGCWFPRTPINIQEQYKLAVHVNGSSRHATIKPFDQLFDLHAIDQVNPPTNVTAKTEGMNLSVHWEKPISAFPAHCFHYEVKIYNLRKDFVQTEQMKVNTFTSVVDDLSKYSVQVRAEVSFVCRETGQWSVWSPAVYVGNDEEKSSDEWLLVLLMAAICFVLLILSLICRTGHLWTKLFPPVPAPKSSIKDLSVGTSHEKGGSYETEIEVVSYVEEPGFEILEDSVF